MPIDIIKESADIAAEFEGKSDLASKQAEMRKRAELDGKFWDEAASEEVTGDVKKAVIDNNKKAHALSEEVAEANEMSAGRKSMEDLRKGINTPVNRLGPGGVGKLAEQALKSVGDRVLEDPEFKAWLEKMAAKGSGSSRIALGQSPAVTLEGPGTKALITGLSDTSAGALVTADRLSIIDAGTAGQRVLSVLDLITTGTTGSDLIEYVRQGDITNNAAPVAEATATGGASGVKPESSFALSIVQETVKTIAHWIPATRRSLADAPQIRTLINSILIYGLREELADQVISGDGVGENFTGLLNITGTTAQAWDTDFFTTTRKARTKVRTVGKANASGWLFNPAETERLDLEKDGEDRYYYGGPMAMGPQRLWGAPVAEDEGMTAGTGMVADWKLAILWNREQANILMSDSHADFFIRNLIAILAELRAGFGVLRPAAFVEIDLTA